jgi:hypothetical protein
MYKYRIAIKVLDRTTDAEATEGEAMQFDTENHDDLFKIVEAVRSKGILDEDKSAVLAIGLKLFSEVVLEKKRDPLFAPLSEPIRNFIQQLKALPSVVPNAH